MHAALSLEKECFIFEYYELKEYTKYGIKKQKVDKFKLKRITSLNSILRQLV